MFSYTRGIIVAYKDVLDMIEHLDFSLDDAKAKALKEHIEQRIDGYLAHQITNSDNE